MHCECIFICVTQFEKEKNDKGVTVSKIICAFTFQEREVAE